MRCSIRVFRSSSELPAARRNRLEGVMGASYIRIQTPTENTMQATLNRTAPQPLIPALARFAIAVAVGATLTLVWVGASSASHEAVDNSTMAMSAPAPAQMFVKLPNVEVVGKRLAKPTAA
jgi:hypothetical protein